MTRVLSALVLLPVVLAAIWLLPAVATLVLAEVVVLLAVVEYAALAARLGAQVPRVLTAAAALATAAAVGHPGARVEIVLMAATLALAATAVAAGRPGSRTLADVAAATLAPLYLGAPLGALAAVRATQGREALLLLLVTVMASDTAQYYGGRAFGRRPLAPAVSPQKTVEGALAGFVAGIVLFVWLGRAWLPSAGDGLRVLVGAAIVALGIGGDLFESLLKRSAGVKDASGLIPGHGGMLDRIDSLLFAAPVYYVFVEYGL